MDVSSKSRTIFATTFRELNPPVVFGRIRRGLACGDGSGSAAVKCYRLAYLASWRSHRSHDRRSR